MATARTARRLWVRNLADEARRSLFVLPAVMVASAAVVGELLAQFDDSLEPGQLPGWLESSEENARAILAAIAGGTITAATVVLSFTLVAVQLASSQYSPRVLGRFLADRFQQVVMGIVFGTFIFSVVVLRELEATVGPPEPLPQLATAVAVLLAVASLLAVLASIDHTARSLQVEAIAERVSGAAVGIARERFPECDRPSPPPARPDRPDDVLAVEATSTGWVQQLADHAMLSALPPGATAELLVSVGDPVLEGTPFAYVWPVPDDPGMVEKAFQLAADVGPTRTMLDDVGFGVTQLVDIAARALSPAINDPYTAEEIVLRITPLLVELGTRDLTAPEIRDDDRLLVPAPHTTFADHLELAFGSIRWHAREQPRVLATLVRQLAQVRDEVARRSPGMDLDPLTSQTATLLDELHRLAPPDAERVRRAAREAGWDDLLEP